MINIYVYIQYDILVYKGNIMVDTENSNIILVHTRAFVHTYYTRRKYL